MLRKTLCAFLASSLAIQVPVFAETQPTIPTIYDEIPWESGASLANELANIAYEYRHYQYAAVAFELALAGFAANMSGRRLREIIDKTRGVLTDPNGMFNRSAFGVIEGQTIYNRDFATGFNDLDSARQYVSSYNFLSAEELQARLDEFRSRYQGIDPNARVAITIEYVEGIVGMPDEEGSIYGDFEARRIGLERQQQVLDQDIRRLENWHSRLEDLNSEIERYEAGIREARRNLQGVDEPEAAGMRGQIEAWQSHLNDLSQERANIDSDIQRTAADNFIDSLRRQRADLRQQISEIDEAIQRQRNLGRNITDGAVHRTTRQIETTFGSLAEGAETHPLIEVQRDGRNRISSKSLRNDVNPRILSIRAEIPDIPALRARALNTRVGPSLERAGRRIRNSAHLLRASAAMLLLTGGVIYASFESEAALQAELEELPGLLENAGVDQDVPLETIVSTLRLRVQMCQQIASGADSAAFEQVDDGAVDGESNAVSFSELRRVYADLMGMLEELNNASGGPAVPEEHMTLDGFCSEILASTEPQE